MKNEKKLKILFITERRADYSRLKPVMKAVQQSKKLELLLLVTGMHLLKNFGETRKVIEQDGFPIDAVLPIFSEDDADNEASMVKAMGRALLGMADLFTKLKPDIIFSGCDIGANFAAAIAGMHMNIHVCHIQGGEVSGTIDEVIRHGLTKFAHIHFPATEKSARRIIKLGEDSNYVFKVGSPSLDTIKKIKYLPKEKIFSRYYLDPSKPLLILLQHPVTTEVKMAMEQINQSISAINYANGAWGTQAVAVYSNNDAGGKSIVRQLKSSGIKVWPHIIYEDFLNLMKYSSVLIGNSSSGIHEAPSFGLPTINVGTRQQYRERGKNVVDVGHKTGEIIEAIRKSLFDKKFIQKVRLAANPYDHGFTAKKIVAILENIKLPPIQKVITY